MSSITTKKSNYHFNDSFNDKLVDNIINRKNDVLDVKSLMDDYIDNYYNNNNNNNNSDKTSYCACQALLSTFHCLDELMIGKKNKNKNLVGVGLEEENDNDNDNDNDNIDDNAILGRCCMIMRSLLDDINEAIIKSSNDKSNKEQYDENDGDADDDDDDDSPLSKFLMAYDDEKDTTTTAATTTTATSYFSNEIYSNSSHIFQNLSILRDEAIIQCNAKDIQRISNFIGNVVGRYYISRKVCSSEGLSFYSKRGRRQYKPIINQWIMASSPVRIDLSGGWTDTPPICYEFGCHVTGMAVTIDQTKPLMCRCRINNNNKKGGGIYLCTESRQLETGKLLSSNEIEINCIDDLMDYKQPNATNCSLLKSCLIHLGIIDSSSSFDDTTTTTTTMTTTMMEMASNMEQDDDDEPNNPTTQQNNLFQHFVNEFCFSCNSSIHHHHCGDNNNNNNIRLELISTSLLPQGSGLGTSSILAGCALAALSEVIGITKLRKTTTTTTTINNNDDNNIIDNDNNVKEVRSEKEEEEEEDHNNKQQLYHHDLIDSVSNVEQLLTSGGGFQDQVNGLIGGIKTVTVKNPNIHPMKLDIDRIDFTTSTSTSSDDDDDDDMHHFLQQLEKNTILVFTGKTRLAKNLLDCVLNRWAKRTSEIVNNVQNLVDNSLQCSKSIIGRDVDGIGVCLKKYWTQKKIMAGGEESGVEPTMISNAINILYDENLIRGASLCGAGGGGFMVVLTNDGISKVDIENAISNHLKEEEKGGGGLDHRQHEEQEEECTNSKIPSSSSYHTTQICKEGLTVKILNNITSSDEFDIKWLQSSPAADATLN